MCSGQSQSQNVCKMIFGFELKSISYWQNITFSRNWPKISHFLRLKNIYEWKLIDQLLLPYKLCGSDVRGIYLFLVESRWNYLAYYLITRQVYAKMCNNTEMISHIYSNKSIINIQYSIFRHHFLNLVYIL